MYFRFSVTGTNSTYSTSYTSTSSSISITYPAPTITTGSWSGTFTAGGFIVYSSGTGTNVTGSTVYIYRSDGTFLGAFGGGSYGFYTTSADVGYYFYGYTIVTGPGGSATSGIAYSTTISPAGVAPSAPPGLYGSNDGYPHGGHFYWSASSGTAPITYYWTLYRNGSFYASNSTAGTQVFTAATGSFVCYVYAQNAYGTSSTSSAGPVTFT